MESGVFERSSHCREITQYIILINPRLCTLKPVAVQFVNKI